MLPTMMGIRANQTGATGMTGGISGGAGAQGGMSNTTNQGGGQTVGGSPIPMGGGTPNGMPQGK